MTAIKYYFSFTQLHMTPCQNETQASDMVLMLHDCKAINMARGWMLQKANINLVLLDAL